jgi:hypothetical protein
LRSGDGPGGPGGPGGCRNGGEMLGALSRSGSSVRDSRKGQGEAPPQKGRPMAEEKQDAPQKGPFSAAEAACVYCSLAEQCPPHPSKGLICWALGRWHDTN